MSSSSSETGRRVNRHFPFHVVVLRQSYVRMLSRAWAKLRALEKVPWRLIVWGLERHWELICRKTAEGGMRGFWEGREDSGESHKGHLDAQLEWLGATLWIMVSLIILFSLRLRASDHHQKKQPKCEALLRADGATACFVLNWLILLCPTKQRRHCLLGVARLL